MDMPVDFAMPASAIEIHATLRVLAGADTVAFLRDGAAHAAAGGVGML